MWGRASAWGLETSVEAIVRGLAWQPGGCPPLSGCFAPFPLPALQTTWTTGTPCPALDSTFAPPAGEAQGEQRLSAPVGECVLRGLLLRRRCNAARSLRCKHQHRPAWDGPWPLPQGPTCRP